MLIYVYVTKVVFKFLFIFFFKAILVVFPEENNKFDNLNGTFSHSVISFNVQYRVFSIY